MENYIVTSKDNTDRKEFNDPDQALAYAEELAENSTVDFPASFIRGTSGNRPIHIVHPKLKLHRR